MEVVSKWKTGKVVKWRALRATRRRTLGSRRIAETTGVTDVMQARYVTSDGARWPLSPLSVRALFPVSTIALPLLPVLNV